MKKLLMLMFALLIAGCSKPTTQPKAAQASQLPAPPPPAEVVPVSPPTEVSHEPTTYDILHSLTIFDARDRCPNYTYLSEPSVAMQLTFSTYDGELALWFKVGYRGPDVPHYSNADITKPNSYKPRPVFDERVATLLPCLLKGGLAK